MAKEIKFNIKLNIDGKQVIVQASESVKELQRNLMAAKTSSQRLNATLIKFNQVAQVCTNVSGALSTLNHERLHSQGQRGGDGANQAHHHHEAAHGGD